MQGSGQGDPGAALSSAPSLGPITALLHAMGMGTGTIGMGPRVSTRLWELLPPPAGERNPPIGGCSQSVSTTQGLARG